MHRALKRRTTQVVGVAVALTMFSACTPAEAPKPIATPGVEPTGTVELWHFFTDREAKALDDTLARFKAKYPKVTLTVKGGQDDAKVTTAIGAGTGPDVAISYSTDIVGKFCAAGAWVDLNPYLQRDGVDLTAIPEVARSYTEFRGKRCAMPFLADAYGFYFNKAMFAEAGLTEAPKTLAELSDMAKKLTKRKPDGTIERAGFLPLFGFYENSPSHFAPMAGAKWLNADGTSAIGADPAWKALLTWQKELVDWYGYDKLEKFRASLGDEWSADNAFHKGKIAMAVDGEWRMAFLKDQAPEVQFGVAPLPVLDASHAGAGYISGNVTGVSRTARNPEAAWALIKFLTTETDSIVELSNGIRNVPTTTAALTSPQLHVDPAFQVFLDIFANPNSGTTPPSAIGPGYQDTLSEFLMAWQSGSKKDLAAGLADVDTRVNKMIELAG